MKIPVAIRIVVMLPGVVCVLLILMCRVIQTRNVMYHIVVSGYVLCVENMTVKGAINIFGQQMIVKLKIRYIQRCVRCLGVMQLEENIIRCGELEILIIHQRVGHVTS